MKSKTKWGRIAFCGLFALLAVYGVVQWRLASQEPQAVLPVEKPGAMPAEKKAAEPSSVRRVTMIDLGATECIPCKMMAPIIEELKVVYAGKADILFIDVWKHPDQAKKYGIRAIPTQIFYDANGREAYRNEGFMDKQRIIGILSKLGVS
jgi:thioredoxin 1